MLNKRVRIENRRQRSFQADRRGVPGCDSAISVTS
jgi:hypothetical protein